MGVNILARSELLSSKMTKIWGNCVECAMEFTIVSGKDESCDELDLTRVYFKLTFYLDSDIMYALCPVPTTLFWITPAGFIPNIESS